MVGAGFQLLKLMSECVGVGYMGVLSGNDFPYFDKCKYYNDTFNIKESLII